MNLGVSLKGIKDSDVPELYVKEISKLTQVEQSTRLGQIAKELSDISDFSNLSRGQIM